MNIRTIGRDYYARTTGYVVENAKREVVGTFSGDSDNQTIDLAYARALMCARNAAQSN